MPWLLNEDAALKGKLQGLTVDDVNAPVQGRPVAVRFRLPETELADMTFPCIVIEHSGISVDHEREHRGMIRLPYIPETLDPRGLVPLNVDVVDGIEEADLGPDQAQGLTPEEVLGGPYTAWDIGTTYSAGEFVKDGLGYFEYVGVAPAAGNLTSDGDYWEQKVMDDGVDERLTGADDIDPKTLPYLTEYPIPYNLDYQITVYSRKAIHDRVLTAALAASDRIPGRFGFLEIPQDGTYRRLDLIGGPESEADKDRDGKRIFRSTYAVRVSSELIQGAVETYYQVLSNPDLLLEYSSDTYDVA
jgi:hypothetical protein